MDGAVQHTVLEPGSVQRVTRDPINGVRKKVQPIDFILSEHTTPGPVGGGTQALWVRARLRADEFRLWLATSCCACLSSVPSFALVIIAAVLIMLLVSGIPLAFVLTRMRSEPSTAATDEDAAHRIEMADNDSMLVHRSHSAWPDPAEVAKYHDWDDADNGVLQATSLLPPNISSCHVYGFACTDKPHMVIPKNQRCDGFADCDDASDEKDCHECQTTLSCPLKSDSQFKQRFCLTAKHLCDNVTHCGNGEDEDTQTYCRSDCDGDLFACHTANICIPRDAVCDGVEQCPFGDDEHNCKEDECRGGAKRCGDKCLPKRMLCDGHADCKDRSDEMDCDCASCSGKNSVLCEGKEKYCVDKRKLCDGHADCPGGEDEQGCHGVCTVKSKKKKSEGTKDPKEGDGQERVICADGQEREWKEACSGLRPECTNSCTQCNPETAFQCTGSGNNTTAEKRTKREDTDGEETKDGRMDSLPNSVIECIHRSLVCDGKKDCSDGSDESNCDCKREGMTKCQEHGKGLPAGRCYSDAQKCDGYMDCVGGEDERNCEQCKNGAFHCPTEKRCIGSMKRCDGHADCTDETDELDCSCEECLRHSSHQQMYMCSEAQRCFPLADVCRPYSQCPNATKMDQLFCAFRMQDGHEHI